MAGCAQSWRCGGEKNGSPGHAVISNAEMSQLSGYSGTPLVVKLGVRPSFRIRTKNAPTDYLTLLSSLPRGVIISNRLRGSIDLWHVFTTSRIELKRQLEQSVEQIRTRRDDLGVVAEEGLRRALRGHRGRCARARASDGVGRCEGMCHRRNLVGACSGRRMTSAGFCVER